MNTVWALEVKEEDDTPSLHLTLEDAYELLRRNYAAVVMAGDHDAIAAHVATQGIHFRVQEVPIVTTDGEVNLVNLVASDDHADNTRRALGAMSDLEVTLFDLDLSIIVSHADPDDLIHGHDGTFNKLAREMFSVCETPGTDAYHTAMTTYVSEHLKTSGLLWAETENENEDEDEDEK